MATIIHHNYDSHTVTLDDGTSILINGHEGHDAHLIAVAKSTSAGFAGLRAQAGVA